MKLVEQYLELVGQELPFKGREDIKAELRGLLLDEIENNHGSEPSDEQIKATLKGFGAPGAVARRYHAANHVIAPGFTAFYFFLLKLVLGALAIAFFVVFLLGQLELEMEGPGVTNGGITLATVMTGLGRWILNTAQGWLTAVGTVTIGFILASRLGEGKEIDLEEDWNPESLKSVVTGSPEVSRIGCIIGMGVLAVLMVLVNIFPQALFMAEEFFLQSGLELGHRLEMLRLKPYLAAITFVWLLDFAHYALLLLRGVPGKASRIIEGTAAGLSLLVLGLLIADSGVYAEYTGLIGFRLLFVIFFCISLADAGSLVWRSIKAGITKKPAA